MKTFAILSGLAALAAAAPFQTGISGMPAPSGTAPPYPPHGTGAPMPSGAIPWGPPPNGTYGHPHHHPSGYGYPTGTAPPPLPTGTAPYKRQLEDMTGMSMPSLSLPTEAAGSGLSLPTGLGSSFGSGLSLPAGGLGSESGSGFALPTGGLGSGSSPSISLPTGLASGSAAATGISGFELARRKAQFDGMPSFTFLSQPTASLGGGSAAPTDLSGLALPSVSMPAEPVAPTGTLPTAPSGAASGAALPTAAL